MHGGGFNQASVDQLVPDCVPEYASMPGSHQIFNEQVAPGYSHAYLPEGIGYQAAYHHDMSDQTSGYANMEAARPLTPNEPFGGQHSGPYPNATVHPGFGPGQGTTIDPLGSHYPDAASMTMGAPSPALTDEMEIDQPASVRDTSETDEMTAAQAPTPSTQDEPVTDPFVAEMRSKYSEAQWKFLVQICAEHFEKDLREVEENGGGLVWIKNGTETTRSKSHKTKKELMVMTLQDQRVVSSATGYTVT